MLKYKKPSGAVIDIGDTPANIELAKKLGWVRYEEASTAEKKPTEAPNKEKKIPVKRVKIRAAPQDGF